MDAQPTLTTPRLVLRPLSVDDAATMVELLADRSIAEMTLRIPHPYTRADADKWLAGQGVLVAEGRGVNWGITLKTSAGGAGELIGAIGLELGETNTLHKRAEAGYWIAKPHRGKGYAPEALREVVRYGFVVLGLHRIAAVYFTKNPSSGRVLAKAGFREEGVLRGYCCKWGEHTDSVIASVLRTDTPTP